MCDYCNFEKLIVGKEIVTGNKDVYVRLFSTNTLSISTSVDDVCADIKISYCPFCGRKL